MSASHTDSELLKKSKKSCEKFSENLYIIGNEPTLACYRIQEHVHKSGPMIIDKRGEMRKVSKQLQSCCHGLEYSIKAINVMDKSRVHLSNIQELITNSLFFKQQLDYEENVRARVKAKEQQDAARLRDPVYARTRFAQRLSGSFDIPSNINFTNIAHSASADLKSVINQFANPNSPTARRSQGSMESPAPSTSASIPPELDDSEKKY